MEKESFEDTKVADYLNQYFVSIKVDREERPDIDHIYMNVCQSLTGSGGWPLSIFMTPDKKPFFAGTYYPKKDKMGMPGFISILNSIHKAWDTKQDDLVHSSNQITLFLNQNNHKQSKEINSDIIKKAFLQFETDFDTMYGGFSNAPKFPTPHNLYFLLRYWYRTKEKSALHMVQKTLDSMYHGGIFDHIGFGFSRYSTDRKWLVPHFEKMLYDNALLAIAYLETYQITRDTKYSETAKQIFTYILRDMTSNEGGFYSAEDADSEGIEGKFYVFTVEEIKDILGEEDGNKCCEYFDITLQGNFEGKNIPNLIKRSFSNKENLSEEDAQTVTLTDTDLDFIKKSREKIFHVRKKRIHPHKDDKILTAWNGLMIAAFSIGARVLSDSEYSRVAKRAVEFIYQKLIRKDGRLFARYREDEAANLAYVDDYAFLIWGLIELYETTFEPEYLQKAINLNGDLIKYFWDEKNGGLFFNANDGESLIIRPKEIYDGAIPSGNSVSALNFLRLSRLTGNFELEEKANRLLNAFASEINQYPKAYSFSLLALLFMQSVSKEVVILSEEKSDELKKMIEILHEKFSPFTIAIVCSNDNKKIHEIAPFLSDYKTINGKPTAYICEHYSCKAPVTDTKDMKQMLE